MLGINVRRKLNNTSLGFIKLCSSGMVQGIGLHLFLDYNDVTYFFLRSSYVSCPSS